MDKREIEAKNLVLGMEFDKYLIEHPEMAEKIPENALVIFLPEYDPELSRENQRIAEGQREAGQAVVFVKIEKLAPVSQSRLIGPKLELQKV